MIEIKQIFKNNVHDINGGESNLGMALRTIVAEEGMEVYRSTEKLSARLKESDVVETEIRQVEMVLETGSFVRYLDQLADGISSIDINNIIQVSMTAGLSLDTVRKIVSDLLYGIGIPQKINVGSFDEKREFAANSIYISPYACRYELNKIEELIKSKTKLTEWQVSYLNYCYQAGVPKAARLLGQMYQQGIDVDENPVKAAEYLKTAVSMGDAEAMVLLGDYFFGEAYYDAAYELYTGPGTYAVNEQRRGRVRLLQKIKKFNAKGIFMWIALAVILEIIMLFLPASVITGSHNAVKVICTLLNICSAALVVFTNFKRPFFDLRKYSMAFSGIFFIYAFFYIMF